MRRLLTGLFTALLPCLPIVASAQTTKVYVESRGVVLNAAALNGAAAARTTSAIDLDGYSTLTLGVRIVTDGGLTGFQITCTGTLDLDSDSTTNYKIPVIVSTSSSGTVTYAQYTGTYALTATDNVSVTLGAHGHRSAKCVCTAIGTADAGDTCTIRAAVSVP